MPKTYEHTFSDLNGAPDEPTDTQVDLGTPARQDATGADIINPAPGNPDKGKPDQFGDLGGKKDDGDDGIDIVDGGDQVATGDEEDDVVTGGDDEDLKGLSQAVRQRVLRERRLREEAEARQRETEARFAELNTKIDLQAKETEWRSADEKADTELTTLKAQKAAAMEAGETSKVVDLDDKITDIKADKRAREAERTRLREAATKKPDAAAAAATKKLHPKAEAWIEAHPQYKNNASFRAAATAADALLYQGGQNLNSDQYYVKLTKILADQGFDIKPDDPYLKVRKQPRPGPRGVGSDGTRGGQTNTQVNRDASGRTRVVITKEDKAMAAAMGLDVSDPSVLRSMAREKVAQARAERSDQ